MEGNRYGFKSGVGRFEAHFTNRFSLYVGTDAGNTKAEDADWSGLFFED